jgi:KDO2-lipid IV(A) lauroyltransferase
VYYFIFPIFYLISLLPLRVLYLLSDVVYLIIYYLVKYRRDVVYKNLTIAFPNATHEEKIKISKSFYKKFVDTFIETIKLISISKKEFLRRIDFDASVFDELHKQGKNVQIHTGHFFNYEFMNLSIALKSKFAFLGIFTPISSKVFYKIMWNMRSKFGTILIPSSEFKNNFHMYANKEYGLGLVADQNPGSPLNAYWVDFFGKKTAFVRGPEKGSKQLGTAVVMLYINSTKRGYYKLEASLLTTNAKDTPDGFVTKKLIEFIETKVKEHPSNYLWTHKRWKYEFDKEKYGHLVIN